MKGLYKVFLTLERRWGTLKPLIVVTQVRNPNLRWEARTENLLEVGVGQNYELAIDSLLEKLKELNRPHERSAYEIRICS